MLGKGKVQLQMRAMKCACFFALSLIGPRMLILLLLEKLFTSVTQGTEKHRLQQVDGAFPWHFP